MISSQELLDSVSAAVRDRRRRARPGTRIAIAVQYGETVLLGGDVEDWDGITKAIKTHQKTTKKADAKKATVQTKVEGGEDQDG